MTNDDRDDSRGITTLSQADDLLGSITSEALLKQVTATDGRQLNRDRLGSIPPHQFAVMAYFVVDEKNHSRMLSRIELRPL